MQFLSISKRKVEEFGAEAFTPELVEAEANSVRTSFVAGTLRQVWRRGDCPGAVILWEAESEADVRKAVERLPLFRKGMLEVQMIVRLDPYPAFGPRS